MLLFYPQIDVARIAADGFRVPLAAASIAAFNETQNVAVTTLVTDADGVLHEGSFDDGTYAAAAGDVIKLSVAGYPNVARLTLQTTQALAYESADNDVATFIVEDLFTPAAIETVDIYARDANEPDDPGELIGSVPVGAASYRLPYQTTVDKDLFLWGVPRSNNATRTEKAFVPAEAFSISIPGTGGGGGTVGDIDDGGAAAGGATSIDDGGA